ncbi:MAG: hypothetical protein CM15mP123_06320 [Gammaproteobacteria bacterium]|nr:MAG: hypothetical protein CM15mP123_06320 [Gammaproteobacteria bacterium]
MNAEIFIPMYYMVLLTASVFVEYDNSIQECFD